MEGQQLSKRAINRLTDIKIRSFIGKARAEKSATKKLSDGGALYMMLTPAGTPVWRVKYRVRTDGELKERVFAVGTYPEISLEQARAQRDAVKGLLREGRDPVQARFLVRADGAASSSNTFELVYADWLAKQRKDWSEIHYKKSKRAFERDVLPRLGKLPVKDIKPAMVAGVIEAIMKRGARDTAGKVLQHVEGVFDLAQARGLRHDNPATPVHAVLPSKRRRERMPALLSFPALGQVLRDADAAKLSRSVRMAHRLLSFSTARIGNVVEAEWAEFDLGADAPSWTIPRRKMKSQDRDHDHKIILGPVIAEELRQWQKECESKRYVCPSPAGGKFITREAVEKAYRVTLGLAGKHSPHGWRAAFSTLARDKGFDRDAVELTLDHIHDNDVVRAYDRGQRLEQRIKLMAWWGEQLAHAQRGAEVVPIGNKAA